jgi:hypothetical protein
MLKIFRSLVCFRFSIYLKNQNDGYFSKICKIAHLTEVLVEILGIVRFPVLSFPRGPIPRILFLRGPFLRKHSSP